MRYSIESRERIYVKRYGFLSFAKNIGKNLSNKYEQNIFDTAKKSATDVIKTASKRAIHKNAEAPGDLIGNKIAEKITSISKNSIKELPNNDDEKEDVEITTHKKDIYDQKKYKELLMN